MTEIFPPAIQNLPEADIPLEGLTAFLSQGENHQILFMAFETDAEIAEHRHEAQTGFVLAGKIELTVKGERKTYTKGDRYHIEAGVPHAAKVFAGYADITFFDAPNRYVSKQSN